MSTVVVTGVSGALGSRVASLLVDRGDLDRLVGIDVVPPVPDDPRLDFRQVDLSAPAPPGDPELTRAFDGASAVVHLAWRVPSGSPSGPAPDANRRALLRVLDAAAGAGVETVVHLSSATVYGAWPDNKIPLTEDARIRPNPEFAFAVSKAEAERVLSEWADSHPGVAVSVLRPAVTVGSRDPLYQALAALRSPRLADESRPVQYLHIDDLAGAVVLAWEKRLGGVYNVAPDAGIREDEARALAGGVARVALPDRLAALVASAGWRLWRRGVPPQALAYASQPWVVAADRLKAAGWSPGHTSAEALVATDDRPHWDDLPPGRRQNLNLLLAGLGLAGTASAAALVIRAQRRRRAARP